MSVLCSSILNINLNVTPSCDRAPSLSFPHFGYCLIESRRSACTASLPSHLLRRARRGRLLRGAKWWWRIGPVMTRPLSLHLTVWLCASGAECRHLSDSHLLSGILMQSRTALTTHTHRRARTHGHTHMHLFPWYKREWAQVAVRSFPTGNSRQVKNSLFVLFYTHSCMHIHTPCFCVRGSRRYREQTSCHTHTGCVCVHPTVYVLQKKTAKNNMGPTGHAALHLFLAWKPVIRNSLPVQRCVCVCVCILSTSWSHLRPIGLLFGALLCVSPFIDLHRRSAA